MASDSSHEQCRRGFLQTSGSGLASGLAMVAGPGQPEAQSYRTSVNPGQRSASGLTPTDTAVVFIDPQNDVLSEKGKAWAAVGESVTENKTVENMERIFQAAKQRGFEVFISPHYFYPTDSGWKFNGPLETGEFADRVFARRGALNLDAFSGSGADWLERFKPYIEDGKTIVVSPHKVFGPQTNDLICSSASGVWAGSSSAGCWRTCVSNHTCATCSSRASRSRWHGMRPRLRDTPSGGTG